MYPRPMKWSDLVIGTAAMVAVGTFALAQVVQQNETANRIKCASNLRMIGQAMLLYSNDNKGAYPRTIWDGDKPQPTWATPYEGMDKPAAETGAQASPFDAKASKALPAANDVTAAAFLLLRTQHISATSFICPSTGQTPLNFGRNKAGNWTNWAGKASLADHLSYSFANPYPSAAVAKAGFELNNALSAEFALVADMNPGVDLLTKLEADSSRLAMNLGNSINHDRVGQNVLYGDGHVEFVIDPMVGVGHDNIYTYGPSGQKKHKPGEGGIVGPPAGVDDSVLLPTSRDLGMIDEKGELTDQTKQRRAAVAAGEVARPAVDLEAIKKKLVGSYTRDEAGANLTLQITADSITASAGPVKATMGYVVQQAAADGALVVLVTPTDGLPPEIAHVSFMKDGGLYVYKGWQMDGTWKKRP